MIVGTEGKTVGEILLKRETWHQNMTLKAKATRWWKIQVCQTIFIMSGKKLLFLANIMVDIKVYERNKALTYVLELIIEIQVQVSLKIY